MVDFQTFYPIPKGITAIVGSGGKTTLSHLLAEQLNGTVIFTTTTRIFPSESLPVYVGNDEIELQNLLNLHKKICIGAKVDGGKLAQSTIPFHRLNALANYVLVEADGSKNLPLKAHRPTEPVFPEDTKLRILVVGASGFGKKIQDVCHCPDLFAQLSNSNTNQTVTPEILASVLRRESLYDLIMVNQCEGDNQVAFVNKLAKLLDIPLIYGSLLESHLTQTNI